MAHPIVLQLIRHFGQRLRYVFRHFPLSEIHPYALPAAQAAEFAGARGKFWEMHDAIYANQHQLSPQLFFVLAAQLGLSQLELRDELAQGGYLPKIQSDFLGGVRSGVNGTPTFFIDGQRYDGPVSFDGLAEALDQVIAVRA
jgi:protein-disulfide isomerase